MDEPTAFEQVVASIQAQLTTVVSAPVPIVVLLGLISVVIWRAMEWRYAGQIARLESDVKWAGQQIERSALSGGASASRVTSAPSSPTRARESSNVIPNVQRVFIADGLTLDQLVRINSEPLSVSNGRFLESQLGLWTHFSGSVDQCGLMEKQIYVSLKIENRSSLQNSASRSVFLWFRDTTPQLEALRTGDCVRGIGEIQTINPIGTILINCELAN